MLDSVLISISVDHLETLSLYYVDCLFVDLTLWIVCGPSYLDC